MYYSSFPIKEQGLRGTWDFELQPVYTVGILDFIFDDHKDEDELLHIVELKNQRCEVFYDKLKFIYIELPKFKKTESELETQFDKWLYVFRHLPDLNTRPAALQERVFKKLFEVAEIAKFTLPELEAYESSLKYFRDWNNTFETVKMEKMEAERKAREAESKAAEAESKAAEAESKATEAESKATEAESKATEAESKATEAESKAAEAESKAAEAESKAAEAESKAAEAEKKVIEAERKATVETATVLKKNGVSIEIIIKSTGLSREKIEAL